LSQATFAKPDGTTETMANLKHRARGGDKISTVIVKTK
jgi:hypothetical protein